MFNKVISKVRFALNFKSADYWENRYATGGNSGAGSYGLFADAKASVLNNLINEYNINEIIEFGCGDGNQLALYNIPKYIGLDVAKTVVLNTAQKYCNDPSKSFMVYDPEAFFLKDGPMKLQTAISIDVLFHLPEDSVFTKYMDDLFSASKKYVIICSSNHDNNHGSSKHVRHRKITDHIKSNMPQWRLLEERECVKANGEKHAPFFIFEKNACA